MPSTSSSVQLQSHLPTLPLPILDRRYQRKDVNMILITCRLDLVVLVTRRLQMRFICFAINIGKQLLSTRKLLRYLERNSPDR
ncbi:hypothetical protein TNIN_442931 [Trichonephila inaurata madagascariensis]|uniref:Uncharacterized protein n=1 Tax=Trichonephila inaurata madagascariensis TaxID=2747483 RepID=A0A8X7CFT2_9ARAC|nr:hypothetical protein TNIN_442931 [Trichonephila inaurata madagascariensis]